MLKPKHMSEEQSRSWRPMIGMTHSNQRARLAPSGHRTVSYVYFFILTCLFFDIPLNYITINFY